MKKKHTTKLHIFFVLILIVVTISIIYINYLGRSFSTDLSFVETGLASKQKVEDFDYLCKVIKNSYLSIDDFEKLYNIDFNKSCDDYRVKIAECESDYEFFTLINSFMNSIPSVHTNLVFPDSSAYNNIIGYNYSSYFRQHEDIPKVMQYWKKIIGENITSTNELNILCFNYFSGKYLLNEKASTINEYNEIVAVNGVPINEYIKISTSVYQLRYDHINKIPYREGIIFNDQIGEKCILSVTDINNNLTEIEVYGGASSEQIFIFKDYYTDNINIDKTDAFTEIDLTFIDNEIDCDSFYAYRDDENDIAYFEIMTFNSNCGIALKKALRDTLDLSNIIIDIRWNSGGYINFFSDYIYPEVFKGNLVYNVPKYLPKTKYTQHVFDIIKYTDTFSMTKENNAPIKYKNNTIYSFIEETKFVSSLENSRNVYVLIGSDTASAADCFAGIVKDNKLATLIGTNTSGEGRTGSFLIDKLPNSGLLFTYTFCKGINSDRTDNSIYGTSPNLYVDISTESYKIMKMQKNNNEKAYTYNKRLLWDDVLIKTLEIIEENKK